MDLLTCGFPNIMDSINQHSEILRERAERNWEYEQNQKFMARFQERPYKLLEPPIIVSTPKVNLSFPSFHTKEKDSCIICGKIDGHRSTCPYYY